MTDKKRSDSVSVVDKDGNESNAFLYELADLPESAKQREERYRYMLKMGLTEEEAKNIL
jgi:hypothetical protein